MWLWGAYRLAINKPWGGFDVALMSLWVALPGVSAFCIPPSAFGWEWLAVDLYQHSQC